MEAETDSPEEGMKNPESGRSHFSRFKIHGIIFPLRIRTSVTKPRERQRGEVMKYAHNEKTGTDMNTDKRERVGSNGEIACASESEN